VSDLGLWYPSHAQTALMNWVREHHADS
jgi:hypothetical protein